MKTDNKIALVGAAIGAGLLWLINKNKSVDGIGATKRKPRRIWAEVSDAQDAGIDLTNPYGWESNKGKLDKLMAYHNAHVNSKSDKPSHQLYFNQLRRAYKSIAGTNLPCENYTVRNENGDVILIYNDYNLQELPRRAADWVYDQASQNTDAEFAGYWITIAQIARGKKFVWPGKGVHRGICQLVFGVNQPSERKLRISYLASPEKGGVYPEPFAEHEWSDGLADRWDEQDFINGVLLAFRECNSVGQAQQMCADEYINAHQLEEPALFQDVPF